MQRPAKSLSRSCGSFNSDLRLITPTDPEGLDTAKARNEDAFHSTDRYFHLTHDYLVPSLRAWLTAQAEGYPARQSRAAAGGAPRTGHAIRASAVCFPLLNGRAFAFLHRSLQQEPKEHRDLLKASGHYFGRRILLGAVLIGLLAWGAFEWSGADPAATYVHSLATARIVDVPALIRKLEPYRRWADRSCGKCSMPAAPTIPNGSAPPWRASGR